MTNRTHRMLSGVAAAFAILVGAPTAQAASVFTGCFDFGVSGTPVCLSYDVQTDLGTPEITNIAVYNTFQDGGGGTWWTGYVAPSPGSLIPDFFAKDSNNPALTGLLLGLITDSLDVPHIVMMMNPASAPGYEGVTWATAWPSIDEQALIDALYFFTTFDREDGVTDQQVWDDSYDFVSNFVLGAPFFTTGTIGNPAPFSIVSWFDEGAVIGNGWSIAAGAESSSVPEPASLLLMGTGLAAAVRRRLRR